jgi:hypothetical protein
MEDITPVIDGQVSPYGQISIPLGGKHATQHLLNLLTTSPPASANTSQLLPPSEITFSLAEEIKLSPITEITNIPSTARKRYPFGVLASSGESTPLGTPDARDEGIDDIAIIVASGRMNEYFEKKEREKALRGKRGELTREAVAPKVNAELAHNTLTLADGTMILVGGERFRSAETLMEGVQEPVEEIVMGIPDAIMLAVEMACRGEYAGKRADLWQHMVIVGGGARIKGMPKNTGDVDFGEADGLGFKEALTANLASRLSVQSMPGHDSNLLGFSLLSQAGGSGTPINGGTGANTPILGGGGQTGMHPPGAIIRVLKIPDYFIEWRDTAANGELGPGKMGAQEEAAFLGGQIVSKLSFHDPASGNFVTRAQYATRGPAAILAL